MSRVLPDEPYRSLGDYLAVGGGKGLTAARAVAPDVVIDEVEASGLRGRGGAGFPTGVKWRTVRSFESPLLHTSVVVNASEGEPGTFKDRTILDRNPYAVLEGALIAAHAMGARGVVIATKATFVDELTRVRSAIAEVVAAGWCQDVSISVTEGPSEYLFGEETGLLEVIDGRPPFPRIAPPFRRGVVEVVASQATADSGSGLAADVQMAELDGQSAAPPVLVNNVETFANVPSILALGAAWFRELGTAGSPGTIVCTVSGAVTHPGVHEVPMGTTLRSLLRLAGVDDTSEVLAVLVGVSSPVITADGLDTPLTYEDMSAAGTSIGSAGFIVVGRATEPLAMAAGIARFLSVESCGQCTHCKEDGVDIASLLKKICDGAGRDRDLATVQRRLGTVADGARCSLGAQQRDVVGSVLASFASEISARLRRRHTPIDPFPITPLVSIDADGAVQDTVHVLKQPDWTYHIADSSVTPVDRFLDHRDVPKEPILA
jgi:NADH:ubiquinone oxidoreductase subunit F (NADH-binding)